MLTIGAIVELFKMKIEEKRGLIAWMARYMFLI